MPEFESPGLRPRQEAPSHRWAALALIAALALAAAWWFWWRPAHQPPAPQPAVAAAPAPESEPAPEPAPPPAAGPDAPPPAPQNLVDELAPPQPQLPALKDSDETVVQALQQLLGGKPVAGWLQIDGVIYRTVATVDNLARAQAPSRLWPVQPTPGRFAVQQGSAGTVVAPDNAARYTAFVALAEALPQDGAVRLYARLYPLFQSAYEELGFPGHYFNDRLVAVIDHLLAAPEPAQPVAVQLVQVEGEVPSTRPWVRYEFADARLQALSSGQKLLVRMGPENARRLKAVLRGLRARLATGKALHKPG